MAAAAPAALATDKFARLWDELAEANPDAIASQFQDEGSQGSQGSPGSLGTLKHELKRLKWVFTDTEAQRRFADCAQSHRLAQDPPAAGGQGAGAAELERKEAKEKNKALKQRLAREEQIHSQLLKDLTEASRRATHLCQACDEDLRKAETTGADDEEMELDLQLGVGRAAEVLGQCAENAWRGSEEARRFWVAKEEGAGRRRKLEADLRHLQFQKRKNQARAGAFAKEEERELAMTDSLMKLQEAEEHLGLPRLELDHANGVARLGGPPGPDEAEAEALRSIQIEFDEDGTLLKAEPHPSLGLQRFAAKAIARQDFGMLPTLAWGRLCDAAADPGPEDFDTRLRRISDVAQRAGA